MHHDSCRDDNVAWIVKLIIHSYDSWPTYQVEHLWHWKRCL